MMTTQGRWGSLLDSEYKMMGTRRSSLATSLSFLLEKGTSYHSEHMENYLEVEKTVVNFSSET